MSVRRETISITGPAGTALSTNAINGEILEVRYNGTDLNSSPIATDYTLTRRDGGGTILALTNQSGPWQFAPRQALHRTNGGTLTHELASGDPAQQVGPIPVEGHVQLVVAQAGTATDSVHIFYEC